VFFLKVFEKAMSSRLSHHLHNNNIPVPEQYGFSKRISTENAVFRLPDNLFKSLTKKIHVGVIFYDLAKAFHFVTH
jgi:hypothetical protein